MIPSAYHRSLLTSEEKEDYKAVVTALLQHNGRVLIRHGADQRRAIERIIKAVHQDHPELFYVDFWNSKVLPMYKSEGAAILFNMMLDAKTASSVNETINNRVASISSKIPPSMSTKKRYMLLMNEVASSTDYKNTKSAFWDHTVAGPLLHHAAVCEGVAKLFLLYCQRLDLPCAVISGTVNDSPHAWNMIELYGKRCYVDVTYHLKMLQAYYMRKSFLGNYFKTREQLLARGYSW